MLNKKNLAEKFITKAKQIHENKYCYDKVDYITAHDSVEILCNIHGSFFQRPDAHIHQKQGCPKCGKSNKRVSKKSTDQFILESTNKWGNQYDYSITVYSKKTEKLKYICKIHGTIEQYPNLHLKSGCPYCNGRGISRHTKESFINIAKAIHGDKYDYSNTTFDKMEENISVVCKIHGEFTQRAANHIHLKNGCPKCANLIRTSIGEKEIFEFIKANYSGAIIENDRTILDGKEIDILLPGLKVGIEYNGIFWHLETVRGKNFHYEKWKLAQQKGIFLIQVYDCEWENSQDIIKSKLINLMLKSKKIYARDTKVVDLNFTEKNQFLTENHIQGADGAKISYGLKHNDEIVSCMTFGPSRFNKKFKYELVRFCNKNYTTVVGGASKLLSHFRKSHVGSIVTYADKRYSFGNLYNKLGFVLDGESKPSFSYFNIRNNQLYNRMKFQKQYLTDMPHYSDVLSEYEIMQLNGFDRIWDCGQYRFKLD